MKNKLRDVPHHIGYSCLMLNHFLIMGSYLFFISRLNCLVDWDPEIGLWQSDFLKNKTRVLFDGPQFTGWVFSFFLEVLYFPLEGTL